MTYAIIETGGKQLRVEAGRFYDIDRLGAEPGDEVTIDKVLLVENDGDVNIGQPFVKGASVSGQVIQHLRDRKVIVYKMLPKKKTRKKRGHRQELTRFAVTTINLNGSAIAEDSDIIESTPLIERFLSEPSAIEVDDDLLAETTADAEEELETTEAPVADAEVEEADSATEEE